MRFYIVTPSFNQVEFLKRCVASVADQATKGMEHGAWGEEFSLNDLNEGESRLNDLNGIVPITVHHHIQDACSTDGTAEWLAEYVAQQPSTTNYQLTFASEADEGMYDAINRGWKSASENVDIVAHLNCDEQYLSGALQVVADCFQQNAGTDVLFADVIITNPDGSYICSRRSVLPGKNHILTSHLPTFTASTFIRLQTIRKHDLYFDCSWKYCSDADWALRRMDAGVKAMVLREYTTTFADTGENMDLEKGAQEERMLFSLRATLLMKCLKGFWVLQHRLQKLLAGGYARAPIEYSIYQNTNENSQRICFHADHALGVWKERL